MDRKKCKYRHDFTGKNHNESHCVVDGWENDKVKIVTENNCAICEKYKSRYIEYPITVSKIESTFQKYHKDKKCGSLVKVRPCNKEYGDKTYLGFLLGDLPTGFFITHNPDNYELNVFSSTNPAIFVPELKCIIFGMESWWSKIENMKDLKEISDTDIENTWYVQLFKSWQDK